MDQISDSTPPPRYMDHSVPSCSLYVLYAVCRHMRYIIVRTSLYRHTFFFGRRRRLRLRLRRSRRRRRRRLLVIFGNDLRREREAD